jgi:hypothetical protein
MVFASLVALSAVLLLPASAPAQKDECKDAIGLLSSCPEFCPAVAQCVEPPECPVAPGDSPDHGSGDVPCKEGKDIYGDEQQARAVVVNLTGSEQCPAVLVKNVRDDGTGGRECARVTGNTTRTCRNVKNLVLKCEHKKDPPKPCSYRITQVDTGGQ